MNRVQSVRQKLGLTQADVANRVGISRAMVSLIENGHADPTVYVAIALARVLGSPIAYLFPRRTGREVKPMAADRRSGTKKGVPHVGKSPRSRTQSGAWRRKRSDAGKPRKPSR